MSHSESLSQNTEDFPQQQEPAKASETMPAKASETMPAKASEAVHRRDVNEEAVHRDDVPQKDKHQDEKQKEERGHAESHPPSALFQSLLDEIAAQQDVEHKLERVIHFMSVAISQAGSPHFKDFWDAKRLCIELFKENINPSVRVHLWTRYSELCREARRLKEIFDEQSAFAVEQIEMALQAIEGEVKEIQSFLEKAPSIDFFDKSQFLKDKFDLYNELQRELNLLNVYATKTTALRKELIKTEMRIRNKNRFFQRLSSVGDQIFPRRKELIQKMSDLFSHDIDRFIKTSFSDEAKTSELFDMREEIKALQNVAKLLTLNTETFSRTRLQLSECWDSIKLLVQERKKVASEQRALFKQHRDAFYADIENIRKDFEAGTLLPKQADEKIEEISGRMRKTQLGKIEIRELRDEIKIMRDAIYSKMQKEQDAGKNAHREREAKTKARFEEIRVRLEQLKVGVETLSYGEMRQEIASLVKQLAHLPVNEGEKLTLEKEIHQLRDTVQQRKAQAILSLSQDAQEKLEALKSMLDDEKKAKQELKARIETHRKTKGSSSLDFTHALQYNDTIREEKERLEKIDDAIRVLEEQIAELEEQAS